MSEYESRSSLRLAPPKSTPAVITSEFLTLHYGGDSPFRSADRSSEARFMASIDHMLCQGVWRAWQSFHMSPVSAGGRGWNDIAYNSGVCCHGHRLEGRGVGIRSGANGTTQGNQRSCAVVYIAGGTDPLTAPAKRAFHVEANRFRTPIRRNHSDWKSTTCAGPSIKSWQAAGWPNPTGDNVTTIETVHAGIMIAIAEAREEDRVDDVRDNLTYRYAYETWINLINGGVGTGAQANGTPAYENRLDMVQDVLNVPSMARDIRLDTTSLVQQVENVADLVAEGVTDLEGRLKALDVKVDGLHSRLDAFGTQVAKIDDVIDQLGQLVELLEQSNLAQ